MTRAESRAWLCSHKCCRKNRDAVSARPIVPHDIRTITYAQASQLFVKTYGALPCPQHHRARHSFWFFLLQSQRGVDIALLPNVQQQLPTWCELNRRKRPHQLRRNRVWPWQRKNQVFETGGLIQTPAESELQATLLTWKTSVKKQRIRGFKKSTEKRSYASASQKKNINVRSKTKDTQAQKKNTSPNMRTAHNVTHSFSPVSV